MGHQPQLITLEERQSAFLVLRNNDSMGLKRAASGHHGLCLCVHTDSGNSLIRSSISEDEETEVHR